MAFTYDNWPRSIVKNGERKYVGNPAEMKKHLNDGWMLPEQAGYPKFPKALHGPDATSVLVQDEDEMERALAVGWSLKPISEEEPEEQTVEAPRLDPFKAPPGLKAKRGRPVKEKELVSH